MVAPTLHTPAAVRRRIKFHGASLGPLLCWSIVFADIGTSIYYVPGILSASGYDKRAAIFVLMAPWCREVSIRTS